MRTQTILFLFPLRLIELGVLCSQIFVPQEKFLVYGSGDVSQHASPNHSRTSLKLIVEPGLYMLLRFQKAAGRGNYETGNQAFSKCFRFLTIRGGGRTPQTLKEGQRKWNRNLRERLCGHWIRPTYPMHGSTAAIDERIYPEMLSQDR